MTRDSGLQAERTALAWTRTSFAVLLNGVVVIAKDPLTIGSPRGLTVCAGAATAALAVYLIGRRRQWVLSRAPLPQRVAASRTVTGAGLGVILLILIVLAQAVLPGR